MATDVPAGRWAVGVSGGADSVALLSLLHLQLQARGDLFLHVVHLDHQTRGIESTGDADFVRDLSEKWGISHTIARRDEIEQGLEGLPANVSARYRALRHEIFRRAVATFALKGVILAHHADDQAETVLHRLLRGSGPAGLAGMGRQSDVAGLTILRPLLTVRREQLRCFLKEQGQPWREDASNESDRYFRNRLRRLLAQHPALTEDLLTVADACGRWRDWTRSNAPRLSAEFAVGELQRLPKSLAIEAARRWLLDRGVPPGDLARSSDAPEHLVRLAVDAATASRMQLPAGLVARRQKGLIRAESIRRES